MTTTCYHLKGGEELEAVNLQNHFGAETTTTTVRSYSPTLSSLDRHFGRPPITFHREPPSYSSVSQHFGDASTITFDKSHLWEASSLSYIPTLSSSETAVIPSIIIMGGPSKSKEDKGKDKRKRHQEEQQPRRTKANNKDHHTSSTRRMKPLTKNAKKNAHLDNDDDDDTARDAPL